MRENPRPSNGTCDLRSAIKPLGGTVYVSSYIEGKLTLQGYS
ncbi:MAG TPA: hypothetical protein VME19_11615 [Streptosporangiaceae bacterium]|nr:hypothetical protein [Streptosporangiaceae bacterium]